MTTAFFADLDHMLKMFLFVQFSCLKAFDFVSEDLQFSRHPASVLISFLRVQGFCNNFCTC